jgi:hypothetical protein
MLRFRNILLSCAAAATLTAMVAGTPAQAATPAVKAGYRHVLLISVDGMHAVDLTNFIAANPRSQFARLARHSLIYSNAFTTAPSDSFPGMIAQVTGATPKTAGLFYDDSYDRTMFPAGSNCAGSPGVEIQNFESIDKNLNDVTGGGTLGQPLTQIDPANLQMALVNGVCTAMLPHTYLHVNTVFEVIKAAGRRTAWSDKHPAYEVLNGPSGTGIDDLFTPEINSQMFLVGAPAGNDNTTSYAAVRAYDQIKVNAVLNWIDGWDSIHSTKPGTPAIFGMNFQSVSVGQKLAKSGFGDDPGLTGGYLDSNATPGNALSLQLAFVDHSLRRMIAELKKQDLDSSTLVIISAKHGQSPIDVKERVAVDDSLIAGNTANPGGMPGYAFNIGDDEELIWLKPDAQATDYAAAKAYLTAHMADLHIAQLLDRGTLAQLYQDPFKDPRTPDFIGVSVHGTIYTGGSKLSEHGGFSDDDRNVALMVYSPSTHPGVVETLATTTQIAPTILKALGLDATQLQGATMEGTKQLTR